MTKQERIYNLLTETIQVKTSWEEIVKAIKEKMVIKNWMHVRNVLQYMLDNQLIERYKSIHVEEYTYLTNKTI